MASRDQEDSNQDHVIEADCPKCGEEICIDIDRLKTPGYLNWVKCSLCLQYMKEGIEVIFEELGDSLYDYVKVEIQNTLKCGTCTELKDIENCKEKCCQDLKSKLCEVSITEKLTFRNAASTELKFISGWDLAVLFMPALRRRPNDPSESDSTALLSLLSNCLKYRCVINDISLVEKARDTRNAIFHSSTMKLEDEKLVEYAKSFIDVLEDRKRMKYKPTCEKAIENIKQLLGEEHKLHMDLVKKKEGEVLKAHFSAADDRIHQLKTELETCADKQTVVNIQEELKNINANHMQTTFTMRWYNMESTKAEDTSKEISDVIEKTNKTYFAIEMNEKLDDVRQELEQKEQNIEELKQMLQKEAQTTDDLRQRLEENTKKISQECQTD